MKKFKVIEESRFLNYKELNQVKGGCFMRHTLICEPKYSVNPCASYTECGGGDTGLYSSCGLITDMSCPGFYTSTDLKPFMKG